MGALPPPVVTIVDPAAPGPLVDVVGLPPAPRWSAEQRAWAWLLVAILGVLVVGAYGASALRTDQRLDRAAGAGVVVSSVTDVYHPGALTLLNEGTHVVSVLSASLGLPGFPELTARTNSLAPGTPSVVAFTLPTACPTTTTFRGDSAVELRVRTHRGSTTTVRLPSMLDNGFVAAALAACGRFPPAFSLELQGVTAVPRARDLEVGLILTNRAPEPRTLQSFAVNGGLSVVRAGATRFAGRASATATLVLRVSDCSAALGTWALVPQQQGFTPTYRAPTGGGSLDAQVDGETAVGLLTVGTDTLRSWVRSRCR